MATRIAGMVVGVVFLSTLLYGLLRNPGGQQRTPVPPVWPIFLLLSFAPLLTVTLAFRAKDRPYDLYRFSLLTAWLCGLFGLYDLRNPLLWVNVATLIISIAGALAGLRSKSHRPEAIPFEIPR